MTRGEVLLRSLAVAALPPARADPWRALLSAEERARADRFRFERDRTAYVAAHALLRALLAEHGVPHPRFVLGPQGKPELAAGAGALRFSLSHTRGLVAAAVAATDDLGIDAEAADDRIDALGLATRFFAPAEAALLRRLPDTARRPAFVRIWTLKEAFAKATGQGLSLALDRFVFGLEPGEFACDPALGDPRGWSFATLATGPGAFLSVALRVPQAPGLRLRYAAADAADLDRCAIAGMGVE